MKSVVNGSGLNDSVAGVRAEFSVYLNDIYQYPSPVEADILQVQILRENDNYSVSPIIYPKLNKNGIFNYKPLLHSFTYLKIGFLIVICDHDTREHNSFRNEI